MGRAKAFFLSFGIGFCVVLAGYMGLYWYVSATSHRETDLVQHGIAALAVEPEDSKTCLMVLDMSQADFYILLKFNAIQGKVNVVSLPADLWFDTAQRTLGQSMEYAGVMQCVQDIQRQFDIGVDCFMVCDSGDIAALTKTFRPVDTTVLDVPQVLKQYLPIDGIAKTDSLFAAVDYCSNTLDDAVGCEFVNAVMYSLVTGNMDRMQSDVPQAVKDNFENLYTDVGTTQLARYRRIVALLNSVQAACDRLVVTDSTTAQAQIDRVMKE